MHTQLFRGTSRLGETTPQVVTPDSAVDPASPEAPPSALGRAAGDLGPTVTSPEAPAITRVLLGMFLVSLGAMVVEIALTRVFSLVLYYHFAFLVIGVAMLGLGMGGLLVWREIRQRSLSPGSPARWALLSGLTTAILATLPALDLPVSPILVYPVFAALPFAMVGATTAAILSRFPTYSGRVYAADLAGAAAGALLSVPILNNVGPLNALLVAAAVTTWSGWVLRAGNLEAATLSREIATSRLRGAFAPILPVPRFQPLVSLAAAIALTVLALSNPLTALLDVNLRSIDGSKTMIEALGTDGRLIFSRWDAFARTDVVAPESRDDVKYVYLDGAAAAVMFSFDGDPSAASPLRSDLGYFPFHDGSAGDVLAIGPGGGKDVLLALLGGARRVNAVEVNPGAVEAVRRFSDFNGGIYDRPEVEVIVDEGRAYLKRSSRQYDTIYLSLAMTQAAERVGYALAENYLYTVEAFRDYLAHLRPGGQLVLKVHDQVDLERVARTARRAIEEQGTAPEEIPWHLLALTDASMAEEHDGEIMYPLLVVRRDAYTPEEATQELGVARASGFLPIYMAVAGGAGPLSILGAPAASQDDPNLTAPTTLSPTTDDRPFFYLYSAGPPAAVVALMAAAVLLAAWTWRSIRGTLPRGIRGLRASLAYFACLGIAFMLVEVTLIQKLTVFLGHPTIAVTTVLFSVLVFGAFGSWLGGRLEGVPLLPSAGGALAGMLALGYTQVVQPVTTNFFAASLEQRILIAAGLIAPLGMAMGVPFPAGLRKLSKLSAAPLASLAWTANGLASVFGSALAIAVATVFGFSAAMVVGGAIYLAAAMIGALLARAHQGPATSGPNVHVANLTLPEADPA